MKEIKKFYVFLFITILLVNNSILVSQIIDDPLQGSTIGTQVGGSFTSEGYQPGIGNNHIFYQVNPNIILNGYVEFEIKGFNPNALPVDEDHAFLILYDGRGVNEPTDYFSEFKFNFFRWNFHWRQNRAAFKAVINLASPSTSDNSSVGYWTQIDNNDPRDFASEPTGSGMTWNLNSWYKIKIEWNNKVFTAYVDGKVVWTTSGPYDYAPKDLRIWLGSGPYKYDADINGVTFRNFKLVNNGGTPSDYLSISPSTKSISSNSGNTTFNISSNVSWAVSDNATWITLSPASGSNNGTVVATYQKNTSTSSRTATLTATGGGITRTAIVTQSGSAISDYLIVSPDSITTSAQADSLSFEISSNVSWMISENLDWIDVTPITGTNNSTVKVHFLENESFSERSGLLTITGSGITKLVFVKQLGIHPYISVNPDSQIVDYNAGQKIFEISSNVNWVVEKNVDWISFSPSDSNGNALLIVNYQKNNTKSIREAIITVHNDSISKKISIKQNASDFYLTASPKFWNVSRNSGSVTFNVQSNIRWFININSDWLRTSFSDSIGNATFTALFTMNTDTNSRDAKLLIGNDEIIDTVKIIQAGSQPFSVDVLINPSDAGLVNGAGIYGQGSSVKLEAIPNPGWKFINWVEDSMVVFSDSLLSFTIQESRTIIANFSTITSVDLLDKIPNNFSLSQNYPNPFNPFTNIQFSIPKRTEVKVIVYNMLGKEIKNLFNGILDQGTYNLGFPAENFPSGIYFYSIFTSEFSDTKKMVLLK